MNKRFHILVVIIAVIAAALLIISHRSKSVASAPEKEKTSRISEQASVTDFTAAWSRTSSQPSVRETIIATAERHRTRFIQLMKSNPSKALAEAPSLSDFAALPNELKPYFPAPLSGLANIDLIWETSMLGCSHAECRTHATQESHQHRVCQHKNTIEIRGEVLQAYTESGQEMPVLNAYPVSGIRLAGHAVISDRATTLLSKSDQAAAGELFAAGTKHSDAEGSVSALVAGQVHTFSSATDLEVIEQTLAEAKEEAVIRRRATVRHPYEWIAGDTGGDSGGGEVLDTPYMVNEINVLFIRVDFSDFPGEPISKTDLEDTLTTVDGHLHNYSYGNAGITFTVSDDVYRMPSSGATYAVNGDNNGIQNDARALASADYTIGNYDVIAVYFPNLGQVTNSQITYGGRASVGGSNHWVNGFNSVGIIVHEFGHNYGLSHANYHHPEMELGGTYQTPGSLEYGDIFDEMGGGSSPDAHFSHLAKNYMDWLPDSKVTEATESQTFTIYRFDHVSAISNPTLAVRVPMSGDDYFWIGYRQNYQTSSNNLDSAAYVVGENMASGRETSLIDMTPESESSETADRRDAGLPVGETYYDSNAGVRFNCLEKGGTTPNEWIKVQVVFDPRISLASDNIAVDEQSGVAKITVQRRFSSTGAVSVDYATGSGSATAGSDYFAVSGTLTWEDGDLEDKTILVSLCPDVIAEGVEDFTLTLSNPSGAVIDAGLDVATVSILDAGQRVTSFTPPFFNVTVEAIAPLDNGQVMVGGNIYNVSNYPNISNIMRLNADGSVDEDFVSGSGFNGDVLCIAVQSDGKYIIGGEFTNYNGSACGRLVRLNSDGSMDETFLGNTGTGADDLVRCLAIETDGRILVGGDFSNFNSSSANGVVRLNANGSTAGALASPLNSGASIRDLIAETDGKITLGGNFSIPNTGDGTHRDIIRLNNDGSRDTSFQVGSGSNGGVYTVVRQADGKYIIGGFFTTYDGATAERCCRVGTNGALDTTFTAPGFTSTVRILLNQANGKTMAGGSQIISAMNLERMTTTGSLDTSFDQGSGPGGTVYELAQGEGGIIWVGGNFFSYDGSSSRPIVPIIGGDSPYDIWAKTWFTPSQFASGDAAADEDPDGDGMTNLAEMAMGTNPNVANTDPVFGVSKNNGVNIVEDGDQDYLQISLDKTATVDGVWFVAQFSSDLNTWAPTNPTPEANSTYEVIENSATRFTVRDKTPISPSSPRFGRIILKQPH
ncbi:hypothetical protein NT6N_17330 [Oceaniferula spumae]|uniref:Calx-beta domain-containing protein n=1 Tax=Oceaniferula spumae TaxID=2979115 RepID=A0AAT9FL82_9BACT